MVDPRLHALTANDILRDVKWEPIEGEYTEEGSVTAYATHVGKFCIGAYVLRVYQLNDGRRVIATEDVQRLFSDAN